MGTHSPARSGNLINWAYTQIVFPVCEPASFRGFGARMKLLRGREELPLSNNLDLQWQSLLKLLKHAQESSPFYQRRFAEMGIRIEHIQSPNDLRKIPPLTREDLRTHLQEILSQQFRKEDLYCAATGGTTDTPVPILRNSDSLAWKSAVQWRFNSWASMMPGDKVFYLWGARQDYSENPSWRWRFYDRHLMRRIWAPSSVLSSEVFESHRLMLNRLRPKVVYAYPTPLALFCEYLRDAGKSFHRPLSAVCTAESLLDSQRQLIQSVLGCPVFEQYGSRESGIVAGECEYHHGLHLNPAAAYVEFVPVEPAGGESLYEVFITDLLNYGMPLIRYQINDLGIPSARNCPCGRGFPLIERIVGRKTDVFWLPNGEAVPGISLTRLMLAENCPGIKKIQLIQEELDFFRLRFVAGPEFVPETVTIIRRNLDRFFPVNLRWSFERVDEIERERSGKTRYCISRVTRASRTTSEPRH
jgi:phenylacetate-CoA ligase